MPQLVSVNVGLPQNIEWRGQRVYTGIWKRSVTDRRAVGRLNVDGDGQGDLAGHGGEQRAVFVYQTAAYEFWTEKLKRADFTFGQFGENFTVEGLADDDVRIGDRFRIGSATFEVTQPRVTCYRVGIRMNDPLMPTRLVAEGRPGFYLRVLVTGDVAAGDTIELINRNDRAVTVAEVNALLYRPHPDALRVRRALESEALSPGWRISLEAILAGPADAPGARGLATADLAPQARPGFRPACIAAVARVANDVLSVSLQTIDGSAFDRAQPGQFVVVKTLGSADSVPIVRSYSLTGITSDRYELAVKCERNGLMGEYLSKGTRIGDRLEVSAPRGSFVLRDSERTVVFMSAGIGVTPLLAMLKSLVAQRSTRSVWWLYGARNGAEHPFATDVRALLNALGNARSHCRYSRPSDDDRIGRDYDAVGHIDAAVVQQFGIGTDSEFYLCGPGAFLQDAKAGLAAIGIPSDHVFSEAFGAGPALNPGIVSAQRPAPHQPAGTAGSGPQISFARSGLSTNWDPKYASLLEFAEACDVPTRWSCRAGVCHTCESGLISGDVRYEPVPLQAPAVGNVLPCCALPASELVLDL